MYKLFLQISKSELLISVLSLVPASFGDYEIKEWINIHVFTMVIRFKQTVLYVLFAYFTQFIDL